MSNHDPEKSENVKISSEVTRRDFIKFTAGTAVCISLGTFSVGCGSNNSGAQVAGYPIDSTVVTTLEETIKPATIFPVTIDQFNLRKISEYDPKGYGVWSDGGSLSSEKRNDIMSVTYTYPSGTNSRKLLRFFSITDIHITDKESPSQSIHLQQIVGKETSSYSPTMLYSTQVLDAAVQTVNALHKQNPIDFGISLGDACNSTQYNELRWYIDVLDGKVISPSSGAHAGADSIDYQKPFKAAGLDGAIPWYQAIGNHDHFWLGSIPPDAGDMRRTCTSHEVLALPNILYSPHNIYKTDPPHYYMGVIDGATSNGDIIKAGEVGTPGFTSPPTVVPDQSRRSLTKPEWVNEFFKTSTGPVGHGFNLVPSGQADGFACYSFVPKSTIPIKVIVLDNTQREDDGSISIHGHGFLDRARWTWLKAELADGDAAGQLMIIAAHVPLCVTIKGSCMEWFDNSANPSSIQNAVTLPGLLAELHSHPNLLMWIAGHRHVNAVKAFVTDDASKPERGFWQVETSSLHDFPQQLRTFEINLNSDYSISIVATNVDPAVKEGTPAATARKYAVAAMQIVNSPDIYQADAPLIDPATQAKVGTDTSIHSMPTGSYNAELFVQLSSAMKAKMQLLFPTL
ncbi:MAG: TIGR03768 family metallophosphoesterase [Smithellaceae bacterium]|nr:TIGR03768 family metallophosphoesterase [Smithellaceae bacterium]